MPSNQPNGDEQLPKLCVAADAEEEPRPLHKDIEDVSPEGDDEIADEDPKAPMCAEVPKSTVVVAQDPGPEPKLWGVPLKFVSLVALSLQTSGQALLIKWSRAQGHSAYLSSTAVFFTELTKFAVSLLLVIRECGSFAGAMQTVLEQFSHSPLEMLKVAAPSLAYTLQNNLMFYSFTKLSAPVQQVLYQMKVITTAGLGVLILGKSLNTSKWVACFMLAAGIALVQWPRTTATDFVSTGDQFKGFGSVMCACLTSGFAGVWIQKLLQQTTASIWLRNVQLSVFGAITGIMVAMFQDGEAIADKGLTQGYNARVVSVIMMNSLGGLMCAVMLKYAGATLGCFSTALSIILTCILSALLLGDFTPDGLFFAGSSLAIAASLLFGLGIPDLAPTIVREALKVGTHIRPPTTVKLT